MEKSREKLLQKIMDTVMSIIREKDRDEMIYGSSYIEFSDRKIELIDPKKIKYITQDNGRDIECIK